MNANLHWVDALALDDLWEATGHGSIVNGRDLAFFRLGDEVYATDNLCTHGHARLCEGYVEGHEVECPLHQGRFDLRNGQPTCAPVDAAVKTYPIRIQGGRVLVGLD
jgi:naphthalene 1,2-dioxygenase system ferredoxin subunit